MIQERLDTPRLELFPLDPAAASALPGEREAAARLIGRGLSPAWPQPDLLDVLPRQAAARAEEAAFGIWLIVERETGTVVGDIGFFGPPGSEGTVEIGYGVVPDRRRRGYAGEAARALVDWARSLPGVTAVLAGCEEDNEPSIRTLERVGFTRTGRAQNQLRWRLSAADDPR